MQNFYNFPVIESNVKWRIAQSGRNAKKREKKKKSEKMESIVNKSVM